MKSGYYWVQEREGSDWTPALIFETEFGGRYYDAYRMMFSNEWNEASELYRVGPKIEVPDENL